MNARILTAAAVVTVLCGVLPARAADPQLLSLVMPDAKVVAGVNVDQAKTTPFGQYVLLQVQSQQQQHMQKLAELTGFDPTRDVSELLVASDSIAGSHQGLLVARGIFDPSKIAAAATAGGAMTEAYGGVTIIEDPKQMNGFAFLNASYVAAGDVANVKAAIDRQKKPSVLPVALATKIAQWSTTEDAWVVSTVPPSTLKPPAAAPNIPALGADGGAAFQNILTGAGGVKFGANVVVTAQAETDNAQDATNLAGALQLLANLAKMQASQNAQAASLVQGLAVTTQGTLVNVTLTLPEDQFQQLLQQHKAGAVAHHQRPARRM